MGVATVIPQDTFENLQLDAGVLLKKYDINKPFDIDKTAIITATTGGIQATCQPTYSDQGEDIDNCPTNVKQLKHLDGWACSLAGTGLGTSKEAIRMALGAADIDASSGAVTPHNSLKQSDFEDDVWWVGDKANGGLVVIDLKNALSTDGFSLQTTKSGKGQVAFTYTGHYDIEKQDEVPMVFYSIDPPTTTETAGAKKAPTTPAK